MSDPLADEADSPGPEIFHETPPVEDHWTVTKSPRRAAEMSAVGAGSLGFGSFGVESGGGGVESAGGPGSATFGGAAVVAVVLTGPGRGTKGTTVTMVVVVDGVVADGAPWCVATDVASSTSSANAPMPKITTTTATPAAAS